MTMTLQFPSPLSSAQANELSLLVDLEARWENLRISQPITPGKTYTLKELHQKQKAYEAFFAKLAAYNKAYRPPHAAEQLLNSAPRLGSWCWKMRDLFSQVQNDPQAQCPTNVLEKAYRWADRLADRLKKDQVVRATLSTDIPGAIRELEALAQWCDSLMQVKLAG